MVLPGTLPQGGPDEPVTAPRPRSESHKLARGMVAAFAVGLVVVVAIKVGMAAFGGGSYAFLATENGEPVTWDHCHAIEYQVNPKGAPPGWPQIVHDAVQDVEDASGFVFADRGTTTKTRLIGQRYDGNAWEPVLIMWSDRYQTDMLDGSVVGRGGSGSISVNGRQRYVVGKATLDSTVHDPFETRMVLEHELGHVLGLGHSGNPSQLMFKGYHGQQGLGRGDKAGLRALHDVPCG